MEARPWMVDAAMRRKEEMSLRSPPQPLRTHWAAHPDTPPHTHTRSTPSGDHYGTAYGGGGPVHATAAPHSPHSPPPEEYVTVGGPCPVDLRVAPSPVRGGGEAFCGGGGDVTPPRRLPIHARPTQSYLHGVASVGRSPVADHRVAAGYATVGTAGSVGVQFTDEQLADAAAAAGAPCHSEQGSPGVGWGGSPGGSGSSAWWGGQQQPQPEAGDMQPSPAIQGVVGQRQWRGDVAVGGGGADVGLENLCLRQQVNRLRHRLGDMHSLLEWQGNELSKFRDGV